MNLFGRQEVQRGGLMNYVLNQPPFSHWPGLYEAAALAS
jgi:hypothetical protein